MQAEVSADAFEKKQSQGCQYLVLGATGYFGSHAVKWLTAKGLSFKTSSVRIESRDAVEKAIDETCPKYVLCFAGIAGRPNISDEANFTGTFYTRMRIALEKLLVNFPNVLVVRPVYPISDDLFPRSVIAKVIKYPRVHGIPTSFTILDDLWPVLIDMPARNLTGIYNFTNPGTTDNITILSLYKKYIDPSLTWNAMSKDEEAAAAKGRPFSELDMTKLLKDYPSLPHISTALVSLFERMKAKGIGQGTM